jgi:hypothetical protein
MDKECNKVKITRSQKNHIDRLIEEYRKEQIVEEYFTDINVFAHIDGGIGTMNPKSLIFALYRPEDISIEETPEDLLKDYYDALKRYDKVDEYQAIEKALHILKIRVKGVNA